MAAGGASLLILAVISMLVMSSLGDPMPLCSECEPLCRTNCTPEAQANCAKYCKSTQATAGECKGCTGAYIQQQCNPNCLNTCSKSCKKEVPPRPLCSDCHTVCSTNCDKELETSCRESCDSPRAYCLTQLFEECTEDGTCCSSNGACTCECKAQAQKRCVGITDNYTSCEVCKRGLYDPDCYPTCNSECENNCKRKKGCHGHA